MRGRDRALKQRFEQFTRFRRHEGPDCYFRLGRRERAVQKAYGNTADGSLSFHTKERRPIDQSMDQTMDQSTRTELEAAVYRRLVEHLRTRTDVQNIELMNLAGFCRNCLSNWMKDAADAKGVPMTKEESREIVYGMPYDQWRAKYQKEASAEQKTAFEKASQKH